MSSIKQCGLLSACRCYEIKCDTGVVIGNYTGDDNTLVPYPFSKIYQEPGLNYSTLLDEYDRTWGGVWPNPLQSEDVQRTQCWNADEVPCHVTAA